MSQPHTEWSKITDNIFIGTNLCCSVHETKLAELGIDADLDLEEERAEEPPRLKYYLWLPVKDKSAPTLDQLTVGTAFIRAIVGQGQQVYVHCTNGHGRAPTLVAAYLISTGMDIDQALETIGKQRPEIHLEASQLERLREFVQQV